VSGPRRLGGGAWGPILVSGLVALVALVLAGTYVYPQWTRDYGHELAFDSAMFGPAVEQPIAFSHRLHVTDKEIDCFFCHPYGERSLNAGLPSADKCLGCHTRIIPQHEEILKLRSYRDSGEEVPWIRVYYNPDHVFFPHYRHLTSGVECQECHGSVERADRLRKVTFTMGFCIDCHETRGAPTDCAACHQ
jgi:hypothetical protein